VAAKLRSVLLYHVVKDDVTAKRIVKRSSLKTLNGKRVKIRVRQDPVFVGRAKVTSPDVGASNGVIHLIDEVLLP
jgi:uncharacterized surface protein with fasciclin (FAS1) repeats